MVVVYGRPGCGACFATKRALTARGVDFAWRDISVDPAAARKAQEIAGRLGERSLPIVTTDRDAWAGFRKDRIGALPPDVGGRSRPAATPTREFAMSPGM
ncbi:glutaredoxin family protein [Actinomyces sp.]|uniref:glutaredoxin family protein n=1 Tax=Actinomyces sp. TaxID=29317 RepID=UPI0026DB7607|nr:glutaredoxin family protein [Actinomyces sp.]MDO4899450.1 glutaredoxin family protein [Actinomyces sp.]